MRIDLKTLHLFVAIAEERSLTRAAAREHMVLAAASKRIKDLEAEVGAQLLFRHARGVSLTPAGHTLYSHARQVSSQLAQMASEMAEYEDGVVGHVRIHVSTATVTDHLPEELYRFLSDNPQIKIDLREMSSVAVVRSLAEGAADIGIVDGGAPLHSLQSRPYHEDRLVVIVPAGHAFSKKKYLTLKQLADCDLLGTRDTSSLHGILMRAAVSSGLQLRLRMQLGGFGRICRMVQARLGVAIVPEGTVRHLLRSMGLRAVTLEETWAHRQYLICCNNFDALPAASARLAAHLGRENFPDVTASLPVKSRLARY